MKNGLVREHSKRQRFRVLLQLAVCFLLAQSFVLAAAPSIAFPQAITSTASPIPTRTQARAGAPASTPASRSQSASSLSAPQTIPGQTQVDDYTVALYHFDSANGSQAIDATGRYTGTLYGNASIVPGLYSGSLWADGNAATYVETGYMGDLSQGAIELFVDFSQACYSPDFDILSVNDGQKDVLLIASRTGLYFGMYVRGQWVWANSGINPCRYLAVPSASVWPYEVWRFHHVAVTWGSRGMEIWVDGVLHGLGVDPPEPGNYHYYNCNPQMQIASPAYPNCTTPVPVITPPSPPTYPPGDHVGALPSYSVMRIGCGVSGLCFRGRLDEVRVSNIQRMFSYTVVPTSTPLPTQTPVPISGQYSVDSHTNALFHLNAQYGGTVLEEVSQQYRGLGGSAVVVTNGRFSGGLALNGNNSYLDPGNIGNPGNGTFEAWIKISDPTNDFVLLGGTPYYNSTNLIVFFGTYGGNLAVNIQGPSGAGWLASGVSSSSLLGCWHHVAATWGARGIEIWLDGVLRSSNSSFTQNWADPIYAYRVGCGFGGNCMKGVLDEVRVSNVQRTFAPLGAQPVRLASPDVVFVPLERMPRASLSANDGNPSVFLPFVELGATSVPQPTSALCD